jgi:hypothetical protein
MLRSLNTLVACGALKKRLATVVAASSVLFIAGLGLSAPVLGSTTAPALSLSPGSLTFASQAIGMTSAGQTVTATNTGTANLLFENVALTGADPSDFTIENSCIGSVITPGSSCTITVTFSPQDPGTRTADVTWTTDAPGSPQTTPLTGTGAGAPPPLTIDDQFYSCSNGVCDVNDGGGVIINNFFSVTFEASGGTPPDTWSGTVPAGMTLRPSGLMLGDPTKLGTQTFHLTVTDSAGKTASGTFSFTTVNSPAPGPPDCEHFGIDTTTLSGPAFNGKTPSGTATDNETNDSACGGFTLLTVTVKNVNLPNGAVLWVTVAGMPVGEITLKNGSGTMPTYNMDGFTPGTANDLEVFSALPDVSSSQQILLGEF